MRRNYLPSIFDEFNALQNAFCGCRDKSCAKNPSERLSISENDEKFFIDASMPGVKSEEVNVTIDPKNRNLLICGEGKLNRDHVQYHLKSTQSYCYEIPLSNEIDLDGKIDAVSKDGILSIALPKSKRHQPLKIEVTA